MRTFCLLAFLLLLLTALSACSADPPGVRLVTEQLKRNDAKRTQSRSLYFCLGVIYPEDCVDAEKWVNEVKNRLEFTERFPYSINRLPVRNHDYLCLYMQRIANPETTLAISPSAPNRPFLTELTQVRINGTSLTLTCHEDMPLTIQAYIKTLLASAEIPKETP